MMVFLQKTTTFLQRQNINEYAQIEKSGSFFKEKRNFFFKQPITDFF
jgi:hypothetical protein